MAPQRSSGLHGPLGAASVVALILWGGAGPSPPRRLAPCERPREAASEDGWTVWVACHPVPQTARDSGRCAGSGSLRGASPLLLGGTLDLNRADAEVLEVLPGVGPSRAQAIVMERSRRPFASLADVTRVHGIGPGIAAGLAGWAEARPDSPSRPARDRKKAPNCFQIQAKPATKGGPYPSARRSVSPCAAVDESPVGGRFGAL